MRAFTLAALILTTGSLWSATIPRPSPDFAVKMPDGKVMHVSDYRGKVLCLAFILTTCPHCQNTTKILEGIYPELAPKGFVVVEAVVNDNPNIPEFVSQFKVPWPVGSAGVLPAVDYIQWPHTKVPMVPFLVFIDRQGTIRAQYTGVDESFFENQQEQHIRDEVNKLLKEPAHRKPAG
ncbi:MAG TPA: TlpA disulfide reductase family protein [Bryobacteraceae bacterium]|nr:TlpA disulfide reductase family protein [Bryobacteraceae bacterium]